ncbi:MAG: 3-dehydroquinate synthase [Chloroflexota bacterium]|nr:3-dehydroquinate synthase [Chloroflexota bacterium]
MVCKARVVLVGFSGSGKSTVGRLLADRLGWDFVDTDAAVEAAFGASVPSIFEQHGEPAFRSAERRALQGAITSDHVVVATGGGAVTDETVWAGEALGSAETLVVALEASAATMLARLAAQQARDGDAVRRPLLESDSPLDRVSELKHRRQESYDRADVTLVVDTVSPEQVVEEIQELLHLKDPPEAPDLVLEAPSGASAIFVRLGAAGAVGGLTRERWPRARRAWIVTDERVGALHAERVQTGLAVSGFDARSRRVPPGEGSKSLLVVSDLYDWLLGSGVERGDVVVALGGGVIGDLAGFVAATCLRGLGLVQIPTSLLAMVDSSVGGKTGVNHQVGKNLIGAFYQPPLVVIDPEFLRTLPTRELTSGWAEVVKHAVIQPSTPKGERGDLLTFLERNVARLHDLEEPATTYGIRRNVALKAAVVAEDEREAGTRALLNFGHTLGHAIEAAGYRYLHGEAIAVGMRAAARIGAGMGTCDRPFVARLDALLDQFGLPRTAEVETQRVLDLVVTDKKREAGRQRWVLPMAEGGACIRDDVPAALIEEALSAVVAPVPTAASVPRK